MRSSLFNTTKGKDGLHENSSFSKTKWRGIMLPRRQFTRLRKRLRELPDHPKCVTATQFLHDEGVEL